jgi:2-polyprenyl-3-methyl-5-hydroxy-6-metoxy-1,4-benzoquinol methylase
MKAPGEAAADRFAFGENWTRFLSTVNDERIDEAEASLKTMLEVERLDGRTFLDLGSGSGLFSLAARRLGAKVTSFDFDPDSVSCTEEVKRRYFPEDTAWAVHSGSVLDRPFMARLGSFDVVYSWGVLHHTGAMWDAIDATCASVAPEGLLFIALYNDQGGTSRRWLAIKKRYNRSSTLVRWFLVLAVGFYQETRAVLQQITRLRNPFQPSRKRRGMSRWHNLVDWVGGYPFEVAKPESVLDFCRKRGFELIRLTTMGGGLGCNEFVFRRRRT